MLKHDPVIYLYDDTYHVMLAPEAPAVLWLEIGERRYYSQFAGILRSDCRMHRVIVPQQVLDQAGGYTVVCRKIIERTPYYPKLEEEARRAYTFRPANGGSVRFLYLSDVHGISSTALSAARGRTPDCLIMNGDITDRNDSLERCAAVPALAAEITRGEIPTVFVRGNHDTRGVWAEHFGDFLPHREGRTYFTFRLGFIWGICLDCGEDKPDSSEEYGGTVCFHSFRLAETAWLKETLARGAQHAEGISARLVIAHHPFCYVPKPPFDIEQKLYREWLALLREQVRPTAMISGHVHRSFLAQPGGDWDQLGQPCPLIVSGNPGNKRAPEEERTYECGFYTVTPGGIHIEFINEKGVAFEEHNIR